MHDGHFPVGEALVRSWPVSDDVLAVKLVIPGEHNDRVCARLPHHRPEVLDRLGQGGLGGDELAIHSESLNGAGVDVVASPTRDDDPVLVVYTKQEKERRSSMK